MGQKHAIVMGASLGGLCAARVLSNFFDRVTVLERDRLPDGPEHRPAVPQSRHVHLLMARGAAEFEALFPGLLEDMAAAGVPVVDNRPDRIHFGAAGHVLGTGTRLRDELTAYVPSRKHLEWQIRCRAGALDNVTIRRADVDEPVFDGHRVTGVRTADGSRTDAQLVIDATGRGTRLPVWLTQWGFQRPREESVDIGIGYATHQVRIPDGLITQEVVVAGAHPGQPRGLGMLHYEDGLWGLTTFGVGKAAPPSDFGQMCDLAEQILPARISAAIRLGTPQGEVAFHKYPTSKWRRYDQMPHYPRGILPFGDAVAGFNPTFGQGMTMMTLHAGHLRRALLSASPETTFLKAAAATTYPVWTMNAVGDLTLHGATAPAPWWYRPVGELFDQFLGAAESDPVVAEWFLRRFSLLDSLYMVPSPRLVGRTVRHNVTLRLRSLR